MKAKIVKKMTEECKWFFYVYADENLAKCISFKPEVTDPNDVYSPERGLREAMELVKIIESAESLPISETVYETPINKESIKM
jgi:hypothetical protein